MTSRSKRHKVAKKGSEVFPEQEGDERPEVLIPVGGVILKARGGKAQTKTRELTDDEYTDSPRVPCARCETLMGPSQINPNGMCGRCNAKEIPA